MRLDLLKLHSDEDRPNGWIWVNFNSDLLKKEYIKLLNKTNQKQISLMISKYLKAGCSTIEKHLIRLRNSKNKLWLPIPIVIGLLTIIKKPYLKNRIINYMKYFICKNSPTKQKVRAVKNLNVLLAKLVGAHVADGYLQKSGQSYKLKISDGRKDNIKVNRVYNIKKKSWFIEAISGRNPVYLKKWLPYFETNTWKSDRLKFFIDGNKSNSISYLKYLFPSHHHSKINIIDVYKFIKTIKTGEIKDMIKLLNKKFKIAYTTAYKYFYILNKSHIIMKTKDYNRRIIYSLE
ncbi:MAG: hypothetical protein AB1571_01120 [Nanoarchaeota archaeon]